MIKTKKIVVGLANLVLLVGCSSGAKGTWKSNTTKATLTLKGGGKCTMVDFNPVFDTTYTTCTWTEDNKKLTINYEAHLTGSPSTSSPGSIEATFDEKYSKLENDYLSFYKE